MNLVCDFSAGSLYTGKLPIDLILEDVPTYNVTKLWEANLLDHLKDRHREAVCN